MKGHVFFRVVPTYGLVDGYPEIMALTFKVQVKPEDERCKYRL